MFVCAGHTLFFEKLLIFLDPMFNVFSELKSFLSDRVVKPRCSLESFRKCFVPAVLKYFNEHCH